MSSIKELPSGERRGPRFKIEIGDPQDFTYYSKERVSGALDAFGFDNPHKMVDALGISTNPDTSMAVGVHEVTRERYKGHLKDNEILQGVLGLEAMAQTLILWKAMTGELNLDSQTTFFYQIKDTQFFHPVFAPAIVNVAVVQSQEDPNSYYGQVLLGSTVITEAIIKGAVMTKEQAAILKRRRQILQARTEPLYPFQEE